MRTTVSSRVTQILKGLQSFHAAGRVPGGVPLAPYAEIEVKFPLKEIPILPLTLETSQGAVEILSGKSDVWDTGRFFMWCADDARAADRA